MSEKIQLAKLAVNLIAGAGVSKVTHDIIKMNTSAETVTDQVKILAGSLVIGSMAADASSKHVNAKMDNVIGWWEARQQAKAEYESPR